jgi:hypothetical protein
MRPYRRDVDASGLCAKRGMRGAKRPRPLRKVGQPHGAPLGGESVDLVYPLASPRTGFFLSHISRGQLMRCVPKAVV